ncbi:hypothetical protein GCM10017620_12890 [Brevundimonas intermedia]|uniref:Calcium-binding protein n=1 Tax=Brevundimonas intermedia TaxID=74315 RepID=A0ABQ5T7I2_9CAUL|nr:hypothetical protein GCM10017620_12890 [Brevundimonas intermedia]
MLGNLVVPGIGAFVGFVLGALIGNLFGRKKPKTPTANAEVYLDYTSDQFQLGASSASNGGNLQLVRNMAETARDTLNGFLTVLAGDMPYEATSWGNGLWRNGKYIASDAGLQSFYGHTGGQLWVKLGNPNATQQNVASADDAVSKGVMWSIKQTQIIGGDIFAKRALANSVATDLTALLGDLQIASDYRFYAENRELINGYITGAYNSLNQGEKDYYAAHKATIDKAHTQGVSALDGNELAFYNGNKATIDKIISALEDQAIANPWIITLQRINELKLDQWNSTDFFGGLQGFLTSMGLESYGAYMENVRVTDLLGGMTLSVKGPTVQDGVFSILPQALDKPLGNDLLNPHFSQGAAGWWMATWQTSAAEYGVNLNADWSGSGNDVFWARMTGTPVSGAIADVRSELVAVDAGVAYQFSVMAAQHRGVGGMYVEFLDANGLQVAVGSVAGSPRDYGGWHGDLANFNLLADTMTVPAGATHARMVLRILATGEADPYAFFTQPTIKRAGSPAIDWEADGNAIRIDDLAKIGYVKLTEGNTSGKDYLDFAQRTAAVGWSDWSQTTEYETYSDQYGYEYQQEVTVTHTGGDDIVVGSRYGDYLAGAAGWDWLDGGDGDDTIEGGDGNDVLLGGQGRDRLVGGAGDDYLVSGAGDDNPWNGVSAGMFGGEGNDTIVFNGGTDGGFGENGDDVFLMEQDGYTLGLEASGNYDGNIMDYVDAGAGSDTVSYERFTVPITAPLDANFWPHAGNATLMPAGGINGVRVALWNHPTSWTNGDAYWADAKYIMGDWIKGVENVTGSRFNDYLWGDAGDNILKGGDGDDFLDGHLGNDILEGGAGADYMVGPGEGTLSYEGSSAGVFIDMTTGEAFGGHATGDRWHAMDHLTGSRFADELKGDVGSNRIKGLDGDDWIVATVGSDVYEGGDGLDTVDYSTGFASGNANYQVWVEGGYWEYDQWLQQDVWISTGEGHYETQTGYRAGLQVNGGIADWRAVDGTAGTHSLIGVEHVIGTSGDDYIGMTGSDDYITGGKGNDTLAGGGGSDTYYFNRGDGFDQLVEDNSGSNTLSFSGDVKVGDLGFGWQSHSTGVFDIYIQGTSDHIQINGNVVAVGNNKLKVIDFNGAGQLDVSQLTRMKVGGNGNDVVYGEPNGQSDLIAGYGGNDILYGAPSNGWESQGNVFIGGSGNDQFNASTGDDQYAFDVGDGQDVIYDTGGDDTLVFGATVTADSVRTEVVNGDLRIFYGGNGDYVTVSGGGTRLNDISTGVTTWNTVEFINAGGTWIDIRKLDINWLNQDYYGGGWAPIVLDLGDDGLDLVGVDQSQIVSRLESGQVARTGWVGATDGMLAVDRDGDGQINHLSEISFTQDKEGAKTDLEGLRAWDTNGDGKITILDEGWSKLKVWVDRNQNGRSTDGELRSLEQAGITAIDLTGQGTGMTAAMTRDNFVHNTLSFTWSDGRQGTAYDVNLARKLLQEKGLTREQVVAAWGALGADGELGRLLNDPAAQALLAATLGETTLRRPSALVQKGMTRADILSAEPMLEDIDLDVVVPDASSLITLETILANAQFDFSDHDNTYTEDEQRLREKLEAALRGDDYVRTDEGVLGSLFDGDGMRGAFGHAFGRPDIDDGVSDAAMGTELSDSAGRAPLSLVDSQIGRPERVLESDLGLRADGSSPMPEIDQAASLLSAVTDESDVWAPAEFSRASSGVGRQWWRSEVLSPDDLSVAAPVGTFDLSSAIEANAQGAVASQHQQLVQALAAFGPKAGSGSSAIWKRSGEIEDGQLAGASSEAGRWRFAGASRIHA